MARDKAEQFLKETTLKGLVHAGLALWGLVELKDCRTSGRKLLTGALVGWHLHATLYHFMLEKEEKPVEKA